jgi:hypothetical protein
VTSELSDGSTDTSGFMQDLSLPVGTAHPRVPPRCRSGAA